MKLSKIVDHIQTMPQGLNAEARDKHWSKLKLTENEMLLAERYYNVECYVSLPDWGRFWLMWDMSNGHKGGKGYMWVFRTKKEALDHKRDQKKRGGASLSLPQKVEIPNRKNIYN